MGYLLGEFEQKCGERGSESGGQGRKCESRRGEAGEARSRSKTEEEGVSKPSKRKKKRVHCLCVLYK